MRDTAGSAAAPAARWRKCRRGSFISNLPLTSQLDHFVGAQQERLRDRQPSALAVFIDGHSNLTGCINRHRIWLVLVLGHVRSETTTKISIAGVAVANQSVSCRSSLARQRPEILRRAAMFCRLLICRRDPEQHRLAKRASEEIDRYRQLDRFRRQQIARSLTAVGAAHHRAVVAINPMMLPSRSQGPPPAT